MIPEDYVRITRELAETRSPLIDAVKTYRPRGELADTESLIADAEPTRNAQHGGRPA